MYHLRYQLYQLLGLAAGHKVLYVDETHDQICQTIMQTSDYIDNDHMGQFIKYFIEPYALNVYPAMHAKAAFFLSNIFHGLLNRLSLAWSLTEGVSIDIGTILSSASSSEERDHYIKKFVFKDCGITPSVYAVPVEEIETCRLSVITTTSRHYADALMSILCCRGFLSLPLSELKKSNKKSVGGIDDEEPPVVSMIEADDDVNDSDISSMTVDAEQIEARRSSLMSFVLSNECLRTPFLCSVIVMISIPESNCSKKAITMLEQLIPISFSCAELFVPIGRESFIAVLGVLLRQEPWSKGLEWSYIGILEQIYSLYVPESIMSADNNRHQSMQQTHPRLPRDALLHIGTPALAVETLEVRLRSVLVKKRRRDILRDFLVEMSSGKLQLDEAHAGSSSVVILDIPPLHSRLSAASRRLQAAREESDRILSSSDIMSSLFS